jgi:hypothetical protein
LERQQVEYARFTAAGCERDITQLFDPQQVQVRSYGNVLTVIACLTGMASQELTDAELNVDDERYPLIISVRAVKT